MIAAVDAVLARDLGPVVSHPRVPLRSGVAPPLVTSPAGSSPGGACMGCRHLANLLPVSSSERDRSVLDVERSWWTEGGVEETASEERVALSASRSSGLLGRLVDDPDVMAPDPLLVRRLRRLPDDARLRARATARGSVAARR